MHQMAVRKDPNGNLLCPECDSRLQDKWSLAGLIAVASAMDIFAWVLAGLFFALGFVWPRVLGRGPGRCVWLVQSDGA